MKTRTQGGEICILQNSGERIVSVDAVTTCSAVFFVWPWAAAGNYLPAIGKSPHPIWSDLYCKSTGLKREKGGAIITASYEGSEMNWNSGDDANDRMIEVSCTMREEAIETHPNFKEWAGTPKAPIGAIFDDDGRFTGWNVNAEIGDEMKGVKSYLVPSYAGTISYVSRGKPSLNGIGKIGGGGGLPSVGGKRQWMNIGISYQSIADGKFRVTENYLLSGPGGWNKKVYA